MVCSPYVPGGFPWLSWVFLVAIMDRAPSEPGLQGVPSQALPSVVRRYSRAALVQRVVPCLQTPTRWPASRSCPGLVPACPPSNPTQGFEQISPPSPVQLATLALAADQRVSEGSRVWWGGMSREELLYPARGHCVSDTCPAQGSRGQRPKSPRACFMSKDKSPA